MEAAGTLKNPEPYRRVLGILVCWALRGPTWTSTAKTTMNAGSRRPEFVSLFILRLLGIIWDRYTSSCAEINCSDLALWDVGM